MALQVDPTTGLGLLPHLFYRSLEQMVVRDGTTAGAHFTRLVQRSLRQMKPANNSGVGRCLGLLELEQNP